GVFHVSELPRVQGGPAAIGDESGPLLSAHDGGVSGRVSPGDGRHIRGPREGGRPGRGATPQGHEVERGADGVRGGHARDAYGARELPLLDRAERRGEGRDEGEYLLGGSV